LGGGGRRSSGRWPKFCNSGAMRISCIRRRRSHLDGGGRIMGGSGRSLEAAAGSWMAVATGDRGGGRSSGSRQVRWLHHGGERKKREGGERMAYRWARGGAGCPRVCASAQCVWSTQT
jgi:hypothetical protein